LSTSFQKKEMHRAAEVTGCDTFEDSQDPFVSPCPVLSHLAHWFTSGSLSI
jgi:hypothetical protein